MVLAPVEGLGRGAAPRVVLQAEGLVQAPFPQLHAHARMAGCVCPAARAVRRARLEGEHPHHERDEQQEERHRGRQVQRRHRAREVELDGDVAPITVANFINLANSGFYNGLTFHRIIDGFMMQGGDPLGNGTGGSDNTIKGEFSQNGVENNLSHTRGAISMARSTDMDSASSQFFIVQSDSTYLDGQYACFGYVTDGMDIVDKICKNAVTTDSNGSVDAENQPVINSIKITD